MGVVALALYLLGVVVLFGVRSWVQRRRTGSSGFKGVSGSLGRVEWLGGVLFVAAILLGIAAPALWVIGAVDADPPAWMQVAGLVVAVVGLVATVGAQTAMGASWRIGVDPAERTELVTSGMFGSVRNPIFSAMVLSQAGIAAMVPSVVSIAAIVTLVVAVQVQVRIVEEPYLLGVHGDAYCTYSQRTGRFVPRWPAGAASS